MEAADAGSRSGRLETATLALSALAPACLAAARVGNIADAAHDVDIARVLGLDAQPWRGVDALVELAFVAWPVGTRAARAALGGALVAALGGAVLCLLAREVLRLAAPGARVGAIVAAIVSACAALSPAWQREAGPGGAFSGVVLVFIPLVCVARARGLREGGAPWRAASFALGLGLGHHPPAGVLALVAAGTVVALDAEARESLLAAVARDRRGLSAWAMVGLLPGILAVGRSHGSGLLAASGAAGASTSLGTVLDIARNQVGWVLGASAVAGAALGLLVARSRSLTAGLLVVAIGAPLVAAATGPTSSTRVSPLLLASLGAACLLAGVAMQAVVRSIATANLPFAAASAAMVVVLELALPVDAADETLALLAPRRDAGLWDEIAWDALPPRAVVLITSRRIADRAAAARAAGTLRDDLVFVPAYSSPARRLRDLSRDSSLVPLWRDLEIEGAPSAASLSLLATTRAVAMTYEPSWDRQLARHLVPLALFDRFEPEPRGSSDRRKSLEAFRPARERLADACRGDPDLADAAALLLRARYVGLSVAGDRELVATALDDLHAFAPSDPEMGAHALGK